MRHSHQDRQLALQLYLADECTLEEMCKKVNCSVATIYKWIAKGGWKKRKAELRLAAERESEEEIRKILSTHRKKAIKQNLDLSESLGTAVKTRLDSGIDKDRHGETVDLTSEGIRNLAVAHKNSADVALRILGIGGEVGGSNYLLQFNLRPRQAGAELEEHAPIEADFDEADDDQEVVCPFL